MSLTKVIAGMTDDSVFAANKNAVINGNFDIWQRGTSFTSTGYTADRWRLSKFADSTITVSQQSFTLGQTDVSGEPEFFMRLDRTVTTATPGSNDVIEQRVEGVRTFAGEEITVSFFAKASTTGKTIGASVAQNFGTGGSPSAQSGQNIFTNSSLTTSWQKFTGTITVSSISGKTLGSNDDDFIKVVIKIDTDDGNFAMDIARVQLEKGSVATEFERRSFAQEFAMAQRYYWTTVGQVQSTQALAGFEKATSMLIYPQEMRTTPSVALQADGLRTNLRAGSSGLTVTGTTSSGTNLFIESSPPAAGTSFSITGETITFDAEL